MEQNEAKEAFLKELKVFGEELQTVVANQRATKRLLKKLSEKRAEYYESKSEIARIAYTQHDMRIHQIADYFGEDQANLYKFLSRREWYKNVQKHPKSTGISKVKKYLPQRLRDK